MANEKMTLGEAGRKAVEKEDIALFCGVLNQLRAQGFDYVSCRQWFERWGLDADLFEDWCYAADKHEERMA